MREKLACLGSLIDVRTARDGCNFAVGSILAGRTDDVILFRTADLLPAQHHLAAGGIILHRHIGLRQHTGCLDGIAVAGDLAA